MTSPRNASIALAKSALSGRNCSLQYSPARVRRVVSGDVATKRSETPHELEILIQQLRELIAALDARVPHLERTGETRIADDATALRTNAVQRIAELDRKR